MNRTFFGSGLTEQITLEYCLCYGLLFFLVIQIAHLPLSLPIPRDAGKKAKEAKYPIQVINQWL